MGVWVLRMTVVEAAGAGNVEQSLLVSDPLEPYGVAYRWYGVTSYSLNSSLSWGLTKD